MAEKAAPGLSSIGIHNGVRVVKIPLVLTEFTDKDGIKQTKLAVILDKEVRFFADGIVTSPAQEWLASNILKAAGIE